MIYVLLLIKVAEHKQRYDVIQINELSAKQPGMPSYHMMPFN